MPTIREKLAALYNTAREGGNVDAAELVALETQVQAEDTIAALAAEGATARAADQAERERLATIATAQTTARELVADAETTFATAYADAVAAIVALLDATDGKAASIRAAIDALTTAGAPTSNDVTGGIAAHPQAHSNGAIIIDGRTVTATSYVAEPLRCAIHTAIRDEKYREITGAFRRFDVQGGTSIDHKIGAPDWSALPADLRLW